jgi:glycosyltransferase involved in cell wall biosynthesis
MPLNVALYSDALTSSRSGLGRHARELLHHLRGRDGAFRVRPVAAHATLPDAELAALARDHGLVRLPWPRKITAGLWSVLRRPQLEHWTPWADLVHCAELDYVVPTGRPLVVTVHDLGPLTHPEFFRSSHPTLLRRALRAALRRAEAILCVSHATAAAVESFARRPLGRRLAVIPEGVAEEFFQPTDGRVFERTGEFISTGTPFFLWAGSLNPRKNLPRVIAAFEAAARELPHHLVLVGEAGWDADETLRRAKASPLGARIHLPGRVSDAELRGLYQRAAGFVFVSLMEGFGLPVLEAMASGCPVIASKIPVLRETAGEAALLVEPTEVEAIAAAMRRLATDRALATELAARGRRRAAHFRWSDYAQAVGEVYRRVAAAHCPAAARPAAESEAALAPPMPRPASVS